MNIFMFNDHSTFEGFFKRHERTQNCSLCKLMQYLVATQDKSTDFLSVNVSQYLVHVIREVECLSTS